MNYYRLIIDDKEIGYEAENIPVLMSMIIQMHFKNPDFMFDKISIIAITYEEYLAVETKNEIL